MICLVVGYGSIGKRHKNILENMGNDVLVVTNQNVAENGFFKSLKDAFHENDIGYVVIANRTCDHYQSLLELSDIGYKGFLLVEKPLFNQVKKIPDLNLEKAFVAANLRFHPVISSLKLALQEKKIFSIQIYVGQYLPDWRPDTDYKKNYSAIRSQGGGVLRDLCHELDYTTWLAGNWSRLSAIGGKYSALEIDSDDLFCLLMETTKCPAISIQMNYLDRKLRREIILNLEGATIKGDLIASTLEINGEEKVFSGELNNTYIDQHQAIFSGNTEKLCSIEQGNEILMLIEKAEKASISRSWEYR